MVAGAIVTSGEFQRVAKFRIIRGERVVWQGDEITAMKRFTDDVNRVAKGTEFGISIPYRDTKQGDKIVSYTLKPMRKTLELGL